MAATHPQRGTVGYSVLDTSTNAARDIVVDINGTIRYPSKQELMVKLLTPLLPGMPVCRDSYEMVGEDHALAWDYWSAHLHEWPEFLDVPEVPFAFDELQKLREAGYRLHPVTSRNHAEGEVFNEWVEHRGRALYNGEPLFEPVIATNGKPKHEAVRHLHVAGAIDDTLKKIAAIDAPKILIDRSVTRPQTSYDGVVRCPGWRWNNGSVSREIFSRNYLR